MRRPVRTSLFFYAVGTMVLAASTSAMAGAVPVEPFGFSVRPATIALSQTSACSPYFWNLSWSSWSATRAAGRGQAKFPKLEGSSDSCGEAESRAPVVSVGVSLLAPRLYEGRQVFTRLEWTEGGKRFRFDPQSVGGSGGIREIPVAAPGVSSARFQVEPAIGRQQAAFGGALFSRGGGLWYGATPRIVATLGPWTSCRVLGASGNSSAVSSAVVRWARLGVQLEINKLNGASCDTSSDGILGVRLSPGGRWLVATTLGAIRPGRPLPVRVRAGASRIVVAGQTRYWFALQDPCDGRRPLVPRTPFLLIQTNASGRVGLTSINSGAREAECP